MKLLRLSLVALTCAAFLPPIRMQAAALAAPEGIISWWTGDGNANDLVRTNHGALLNGAGVGSGFVGQGFVFDGLNDYVEIPHRANLSFGPGQGFTVEFWLNRSNTTPMSFLAKRDGCGGTNTVNYQAWVDGTMPPLPANQWIHFAGVAGSDGVRLYTNGGLFHTYLTTDTFTAFPPNTGTLRLGSAGTCGNGLAGRMDEVTLYHRKLTTGELAAIAAAGSAGKQKLYIVTPPQATLAPAGSNATLAVSAAGLAPIHYQWRWFGTNLSAATNATLTITNVHSAGPGANTGDYRVVLNNSTGFVTSQVARLELRPLDAPGFLPAAARWRFDESAGATVVYDSGVNRFDGALSYSGAAVVSNGLSGNALELSRAQNGFVNFGNVLPLTGTDFTVVAWLKAGTLENPTDGSAAAVLLGKHNAGTVNGYHLFMNSSPGYGAARKAALYTSTPGNSGRDPRSTTTVDNGNWHQIVGIHKGDGSGNKIYVDGVPVENATGANVVVNNTAPLLIGGVSIGGVPTGYFSGLLDEVSIFHTALADWQIDYLFHHPAAPGPTNALPLPALDLHGGATQLVCAPFGLSVVAIDLDGLVTNVSVWFDDSLIASGPGSNLNATVENDFPGAHNVAVLARDDLGGERGLTQAVELVAVSRHELMLGGVRSNGFKLCMAGEAERNYLLFATTNLDLASSNWTELGLMENTKGVWRYLDEEAVINWPQRFYRALQQ